MFPIRDANPSTRPPYVVYAIILLNAVVFLAELLQPDGARGMIMRWGVIPALVADRPWTLVTSMFLHGGLLHILFNMWFLWIFGDNVEERMGSVLFAAFYLVCGALGGLVHSAMTYGVWIPSIGASGAVSGVIGAYIYFYPTARIFTVVPAFVFLIPMEMPAFLFIFYWLLLQMAGGLVSLGIRAPGGVAYWAHLGGFAAGLAWATVLAPITRDKRPPRPPVRRFIVVRRFR